MKGGEVLVVTNKPIGRREVKATLVIEETSSNDLMPAIGKIYHEGYVDGKKFMVPDSNLDAMANLVNLKMRRRISIQYKHQTSLDMVEDISIIQKLKRLSKKFDLMNVSISNETGSDVTDLLKISVGKESNIEIEHNSSLSTILLEMVKPYDELLKGADKYSQVKARKNKEPISLKNVCQVRSDSNSVDVPEENSKLPYTSKAQKEEEDSPLEKIEEVHMEGNSIQENNNNVSSKLPQINQMENLKNCSIHNELISNTDPSKIFQGNKGRKEYSIVVPKGKASNDSIETSETKVFKESYSKKMRDEETEPLLEKMSAVCSSSKKSQKSKNSNVHSITMQNKNLNDNSLRSFHSNAINEYPNISKESGSVLKTLFSNINLSRTSQVSEDHNECSITTNKGAVIQNQKSGPTVQNKENDSIFKKLFSKVNIHKGGNRDKTKLIIASKNSTADYKQLGTSQGKVIKGSKSRFVPENKTRRPNNLQRLTPIKASKEIDFLAKLKNVVVCKYLSKSLRKENVDIDYKHKCRGYLYYNLPKKCQTTKIGTSKGVKVLNYRTSKQSKPRGEQETRDTRTSKPINVELELYIQDEHSNDSPTLLDGKEISKKDTQRSICNYLEHSGKTYIKHEEVYLDVISDGSYDNGIYNVGQTQLTRANLQSKFVLKSYDFDTKRQLVYIDVEELDEFTDSECDLNVENVEGISS